MLFPFLSRSRPVRDPTLRCGAGRAGSSGTEIAIRITPDPADIGYVCSALPRRLTRHKG